VALDSPLAELASQTLIGSAKRWLAEVDSRRIPESRHPGEHRDVNQKKTTERNHHSAANVKANGQNAEPFTSDDAPPLRKSYLSPH
jgi:hypothetical protein